MAADGRVRGLQLSQAAPSAPFTPLPGTERELEADLVLLAMGFLHPEPWLLEQSGVATGGQGQARQIRHLRPRPSSSAGPRAAGHSSPMCRRAKRERRLFSALPT
jgi:NADPH-dependent glutamate synthase beta subunit-like oxidoreductase